jgi:hypothetical protein
MEFSKEENIWTLDIIWHYDYRAFGITKSKLFDLISKNKFLYTTPRHYQGNDFKYIIRISNTEIIFVMMKDNIKYIFFGDRESMRENKYIRREIHDYLKYCL